jgi:hypothetical protein
MTNTDKETLAFVFKCISRGFFFMFLASWFLNFSEVGSWITVTIAGITYLISAVITANLKINGLISEIDALK